jgi:hypothetical protein
MLVVEGVDCRGEVQCLQGVMVILQFSTYTLQRRSDLCIRRNETAQHRSQFPHACVCDQKRWTGRGNIYVNRSQCLCSAEKISVTTVYFYRRTYKYLIYKGGGARLILYGMQTSKPVPRLSMQW